MEAELLGCLFSAVATGLQREPTIHLERTPRMADAAKWMTAVEVAFGSEPGSTVEAWESVQHDATVDTLATDPVAQALKRLLDDRGGFDGSPTALHEALVVYSVGIGGDLPKNAKVLSEGLRRLKPALLQIGIVVEMGRKAEARFVKISKA